MDVSQPQPSFPKAAPLPVAPGHTRDRQIDPSDLHYHPFFSIGASSPSLNSVTGPGYNSSRAASRAPSASPPSFSKHLPGSPKPVFHQVSRTASSVSTLSLQRVSSCRCEHLVDDGGEEGDAVVVPRSRVRHKGTLRGFNWWRFAGIVVTLLLFHVAIAVITVVVVKKIKGAADGLKKHDHGHDHGGNAGEDGGQSVRQSGS